MKSDAELQQIVAASISWSDAIRKCGSKPHGGAFQYFQARVRKLGFSTSHFLGKAAHAGSRQTGVAKKKHWSQVLLNRDHLERRDCASLRRAYKEYCDEKGIKYECAICGLPPFWNHKELRLQVEHKDDHRGHDAPENLMWICPNCHSQKPINYNKPPKKKHICPQCGGERSRQASICSHCDTEARKASSPRPSKDALTELVWKEPIVDFCKRFGVGPTAVRRWCDELKVVRPEFGYWQRLKSRTSATSP